MAAPDTIPELIAQWPKLTAFAADVGCGYEAVRKMRDRASIAPEHWQAIVSASANRGIDGITFEWLAEQRAASAGAAA